MALKVYFKDGTSVSLPASTAVKIDPDNAGFFQGYDANGNAVALVPVASCVAVEIESIAVNESFLNRKQRTSLTQSHDVELYFETEPPRK